ncbi:MAG TPA: nucleotide exchange factor GrpE [Phycisphaerales bacterium]|nr:nucleotide exchange factor GrpE [Phycisphaerales bacterium]
MQPNEQPLDDREMPRPEDVHDISDGFDVDQLVARVSELEQAVDSERNKGLRLMADFQNYQQRAYRNEIAAKQQGIATVVQSLVPVLDHFDMALKQTATTPGAEQVMEGVKVIREEVLKVLLQHGVKLINPAVNEEFTPGRHEALMLRAAEGVSPNCIVEVFQPGYALAMPNAEDRVIRAAKVVVAPIE